MKNAFFLRSNFLNRDFSLVIIVKSIRCLTVILKSILEGKVSDFCDVGVCSFLCYAEEKSNFYFYTFHMIKTQQNRKSKF